MYSGFCLDMHRYVWTHESYISAKTASQKKFCCKKRLPYLSFLLRRGEKRAEKKNIQGLLSFPRQIPAFNQHGGGEKEEEISPAFFTFFSGKGVQTTLEQKGTSFIPGTVWCGRGIFIFFSRRVGETVVRRTFSLSVRSVHIWAEAALLRMCAEIPRANFQGVCGPRMV